MNFQHEPLRKGSIRLVRILPDSKPTDIRCSIEHREDYAEKVEDRDAYTALSYCWGTATAGDTTYLDDLLIETSSRDEMTRQGSVTPTRQSQSPDRPRAMSITLNGLPFQVTDNLENALSTILQYHDISQPFWIDAICTNQNDVEERNDQVMQMGQIFKNAGRVFAWLGREDAWIPLAFQSLRRVHEACCKVQREKGTSDIIIRMGCLCNREPFEHLQLPAPNGIAVMGLYYRKYFSRVWTQPEYLIGNINSLVLLCGRHSIDGVTFNHGLRTAVVPNNPLPKHLGQLLFQRNSPMLLNECWPHSSPPYKFRCVFDMTSVCECTDPRDRVFAMLGDPGLQQVCQPGDQLGPDYRWSVDELVLVVLAFYDTLLLHPDYCPDLIHGRPTLPLELTRAFRELDRMLRYFTSAFGTPRVLEDFRKWFDSHEEWTNCLKKSGSVTLSTGRVIDCSGPTMNLILNERDYRGSAKETGPDSITIRFDEKQGVRITQVID